MPEAKQRQGQRKQKTKLPVGILGIQAELFPDLSNPVLNGVAVREQFIAGA